MAYPSIGVSSGLAILWNKRHTQVLKLQSKANLIHCKILFFGIFFHLLNIYGPSSTIGKQKIWEIPCIILASFLEGLFILGGDFNAILSLRDKTEGIVPPSISIENFNYFVLNNGFHLMATLLGEIEEVTSSTLQKD